MKRLLQACLVVFCVAGAAGVIGSGIRFLRTDSCTVEARWFPIISPDKTLAADMYLRKCSPRLLSEQSHIREYVTVVLRPISQPPPAENHYREADVVFEVEKGQEPPQLSLGSPSNWGQYSELSREPDNTLIIGCLASCPAARIRTREYKWRDHPIRYLRTESPSTSPVVE